ncbi:type I-Fv CRISPR-associated protein Cas5fv, partial [Facilibium subflavum]|uniref:type I-Fv CRISPR-associated protein Cas5fv n=1 Tax=Facilibium subflavum TaxID=2219058 RepID=UPI001AAD61E6
YQSRSEFEGVPHYFSDIENLISFDDKPKVINQETAYIRNMKGSTDQNSFTGMVRVNDPIFQSDYSPLLWGILWHEVDSLIEFILDNKAVKCRIPLDPFSIMNRLGQIKKLKPVESQGRAKEAVEFLQGKFDKYKPLDAKGKVILLGMYCSALYLQLQRLES